LKVLASYNNLILLQFWLMLIVWPFVAILLSQLDSGEPSFATLQTGPANRRHSRSVSVALVSIFLILLVLLFPAKPIPQDKDYAFCQAVDAEVQKDIRAGHHVLISWGAGFYVRAGITTPPLDQAISAVELNVSGHDDLLSGFKSRLDNRYYDKIF
jgi:hypothetical protein